MQIFQRAGHFQERLKVCIAHIFHKGMLNAPFTLEGKKEGKKGRKWAQMVPVRTAGSVGMEEVELHSRHVV